MHTATQKFFLIIVGSSLVLSLQGCDQVNKLVNYFSPKDKKPAQQAKAASPEAPRPVNPPPAAPSAAPAAPAAQPQGELPPNVLAKVGNWSITLDEFKEQEKAAQDLAAQNNLVYDLPAERLLGMIVEQQLLYQEALRRGMDREQAVSRQIEEARKLILSQNLQTTLAQGVEVTDEEIAQFYEQNKAFYFQPASYRVSQIVVDTQEQANSILGQLAQGAAFAELVESQSKVKGSGELISETEAPFQRFNDVVRTLDVGQFSSVFQGPEGFYIVKLEEKVGGQEMSLEDVKEGIRADLSYLKYLQGLQQLQEAIPVQTNLNLLEAN